MVGIEPTASKIVRVLLWQFFIFLFDGYRGAEAIAGPNYMQLRYYIRLKVFLNSGQLKQILKFSLAR